VLVGDLGRKREEEKKEEKMLRASVDERVGEARALREKLLESLSEGKEGVVIFVGSGLSITACFDTSTRSVPPSVSWEGLLKEGVKEAQREKIKDQKWADENLELLEKGQFVEVAEAVRTALEDRPAVFESFLRNQFHQLSCKNARLRRALMYARERGAIFVTTNYDNLLEEMMGMMPLHRSSSDAAMKTFASDPAGSRMVFHAHGHYTMPKDVVLGVRDYGQVLKDEKTQYLLKQALGHRKVLLLGCGPSGCQDPNVGVLLGDLQRVGLNSQIVVCRQSETGAFPKTVECVSYGEDYGAFVPFLESLFGPEETLTSLRSSLEDVRGPYQITATDQAGKRLFLCMLRSDTEYREIFLRPKITDEVYSSFYILPDAERPGNIFIAIDAGGELLYLSPGVNISILKGVVNLYRLTAGSFGVISFSLRADPDDWMPAPRIQNPLSAKAPAFRMAWNEGNTTLFFSSVQVGWPVDDEWKQYQWEYSTQRTKVFSESLLFTLHFP